MNAMRRQILVCALALLLACMPFGLTACAGQEASSASSSSAASSSVSAENADGESSIGTGESGVESAGASGDAAQSGGDESAIPADAGAASGNAGASASQPEPAPEPDPTITVTVSIDSSQAGDQSIGSYSRTVTLSPGASVYDALVASGAGVGGSSSYVTSINGLSEKACGPTSGWTYYVNGSFPSKPAGSYKLNSDASVMWYYVTSPDSRP